MVTFSVAKGTAAAKAQTQRRAKGTCPEHSGWCAPGGERGHGGQGETVGEQTSGGKHKSMNTFEGR